MVLRRFAPLLLVLSLGGAALGACGGDDSGSSSTPKVTNDTSEAHDTTVLLTADDVHTVTGFVDTQSQEIGDLALTENPDPRGPCGGKVSAPPLAKSFGRSFSSAGVVLVELVVAKPDSKQRGYIDELKGDAKPDCAPYTSKTNTGTEQEVSGVKLVDLADLGFPGIAWTSTISTGGQKAEGGVIALLVHDHLAFLQVASTATLDSAAVHEIAKLAGQRLNA